VFYAGADFDNDPTTFYMGDYSPDPSKLTCLSSPAPLSGLNVTTLTPLENQGGPPGAPVTGFATRWVFQYDSPNGGGCKPSGPPTPAPIACMRPTIGTNAHLFFSKQDSTNTVKRVTGEPVGDNTLTVLIQNGS
jgi:hypothetical protein